MFVKTVHLENLRAFKELNFDLARPDGSYPGWTVFVGGNASGKSTLLKGIAIALMGPDAGRQLIGNTTGWIRKEAKRASVTVDLQRADRDLYYKKLGAPSKELQAEVKWQMAAPEEIPSLSSRKTSGAEKGPWNPNAKGWFSAGYGPMRRLSGSSSESIRYAVGGGVLSRYVTLFREDAALSESEEWLRKAHARSLETPTADNWAQIIDGVRRLLSDELLPHGMKITRITVDQVFVQDKRGVELPMREISDGCRGVYATVLDLVHGMFEVYGADQLFATNARGQPIVQCPGVVLIDEIEAHLHPAWQQEIPYWLKTHFPQVQFLATTHSPLIAQAADPNGIFLLPLQDEMDRQPRPLTAEEYHKVRAGSAHKTVLGIAFGLKNTRSKWANQQIARWQKLEAQKRAGVRLSSEEVNEHKTLYQQLELVYDEKEN